MKLPEVYYVQMWHDRKSGERREIPPLRTVEISAIYIAQSVKKAPMVGTFLV